MTIVTSLYPAVVWLYLCVKISRHGHAVQSTDLVLASITLITRFLWSTHIRWVRCSSLCLTPYIRVPQSFRVLFSVPYHSSVNHTKANITFFRSYCSLLRILGSRSCFGFSAIVCLCHRIPLVVIVLVQEYCKGLVNRVHSLTEVFRHNAVFGPTCSSSGTPNKVGNKPIVHFH